MPLTKKQFTLDFHGRTLTAEISQLAEQANAAVIVKYGETAVLATAVMSQDDADTDYLPLKVDYEERFYAAGKILGSRYVRREGKASEEAVLSGRLVDRTIRPLFDHRIRREIQVVVTVLSIDKENDPDFLAVFGASLALAISDIPWDGPVSGVRIVKSATGLEINPKSSEEKIAPGNFTAFVSGGHSQINMIELAGNESPEEEVLKGFEAAADEIEELNEFQKKIVSEIGKPKTQVKLVEPEADLKKDIEEFVSPKLMQAVYPEVKGGVLDKVERQNRLRSLKEELLAHLEEKYKEKGFSKAVVEIYLEELTDNLVHKVILETGKRPDGRGLTEVRALEGEVGLFPRTHGSALFIRGNTQALAITTLAPPGQEQLVETMESQKNMRFLLHYNFPPYSVGEIGSFRGPGRREIGHGALAYKAVEPLLPPQEEFPYTIRVVSEILSSNGSSSQATICASVLSLMDAGVPIKNMAAGIAMGLMSDEKGNYKILTDIQGPEDHYGDMDFKVAGTKNGVNAVQLDVKVRGLTEEMIKGTLSQARDARLHILDFMKTVLDAPRPQISSYAPVILQWKVLPEQIGLVIGSGGKTINGLVKTYGLTGIDIEEDGSVFISADAMDKAQSALTDIKALTREYKPGEIVEGKVVKIMDFGAIVDLGGGQDGMIHISELKSGFVKTVNEVLKMGDFVRAKIIRVDQDGHIGLSLKQMEENGGREPKQ
jgi:polyribonucleotide nucleotidyltransferase